MIFAFLLVCFTTKVSFEKAAKCTNTGKASLQMLVVTTKDWDDLHGTAERFERKNPKGKWQAVGPAFPGGRR
jgi:hypothetical protein